MTHDKSPTTEEAGLREILERNLKIYVFPPPDMERFNLTIFQAALCAMKEAIALRRLSQREADGAHPDSARERALEDGLPPPRGYFEHVLGVLRDAAIYIPAGADENFDVELLLAINQTKHWHTWAENRAALRSPAPQGEVRNR